MKTHFLVTGNSSVRGNTTK